MYKAVQYMYTKLRALYYTCTIQRLFPKYPCIQISMFLLTLETILVRTQGYILSLVLLVFFRTLIFSLRTKLFNSFQFYFFIVRHELHAFYFPSHNCYSPVTLLAIRRDDVCLLQILNLVAQILFSRKDSPWLSSNNIMTQLFVSIYRNMF